MTTTIATGRDGTVLAVHDLAGAGKRSSVLMAHAAGFHGRVWGPVATALGDRFHCVGLDFRGHGESTLSPGVRVDFDGLAADVLAVVDGCGMQRPYGVGHSAGATALLLAEESRPGTFTAIWCWEPVIVPADRPLGPDPDSWLAAAARRRRRTFPSMDAALQGYRRRSAFADVHPNVLAAFVRHGLRPSGESALELRCSPETEAEIYEMATAHDCFAQLDRISCPVILAGGGLSESFPEATVDAVASRLASARVERIEGLGHLGPLEDPDLVARCIRRSLTDPVHLRA